MLLKKPIKPIELDVVSTGNRGADENVLLAGEAVQEGVEGGEERHEGRDPVSTRELADGVAEAPVERKAAVHSAVSLDGGARTIRGQAQTLRGPLEGAPPVMNELIEKRALKALPLPYGVVGVLDRERRQLGRPPDHVSVVELGKLMVEHPVRRRVERDVVNGEQQHVIGQAEPEERRADHQVTAEVEPAPRFRAHQPLELELTTLGLDRGEVDHRQFQRPTRKLNLARLSPLEHIDGPEGRVSLDHRSQGMLESRFVQIAVESNSARTVVRRRAWFPLVEKPHSLL